jgi:hypothetical protein
VGNECVPPAPVIRPPSVPNDWNPVQPSPPPATPAAPPAWPFMWPPMLLPPPSSGCGCCD